MEIRKLDQTNTRDFCNLIEIFKTVFENDAQIPGDEYLGKLLRNPDFMVFVVKLNGQVVGGLTVYVLHGYYSQKPTAYIYDVGIAPNYQGQGLGKKLIAAVCTFCKANDFESAYVETETDDTDAVHFYRKTDYASEISATHFTYILTS